MKTNDNKTILILSIVTIALVIISLSLLLNNKIFANQHNNQPASYPIKNEIKIFMNVKKELSLEVGSELPKISDYYDNYEEQDKEEIKYYLADQEVKLEDITTIKDNKYYLKAVNEYKVVINDQDESLLKVIDLTPPTIKLQELTITEGDKYNITSFIQEYNDNSNDSEYNATYLDESKASLTKEGHYEIKLKVCDKSGNCTDGITKLTINKKPIVTTKKPTTTTTTKKYVKDVQEKVIIASEAIKYGVKKETYYTVTYKLYSDGSKVESSRTAPEQDINFTTFNGTVSQMSNEAKSLYSSQSSSRNTILEETNRFRADVDVPALTLDYDLSIIATIKAIELAYSNNFDHIRPGNKGCFTLHDEYFGQKTLGNIYNALAENLAYNSSTDLRACEQWHNSSTHYATMINPRLTKIGIGKYTLNGRTYYVQEFAGA